jgi:hypothetical protein
VYKSTHADDPTYILFWVDDILIASKSTAAMTDIKQKLGQRFRMDNHGELSWFLGIDFTRHDGSNYQMSQRS